MKNLCLLLTMGVLITTACKRAEPQLDEIPDAVVSYTISGDESASLSFTLPGGTASDKAVSGAYVSVNDLMSLSFQELNVTNLSVFANTGGVREGSFALNQGVADFASYQNQAQGQAYLSTSGTLTISEAELYQNVGSAVGAGDTYYVSGSLQATLTDNGSPAKTIEVSATFSGIPVGAR